MLEDVLFPHFNVDDDESVFHVRIFWKTQCEIAYGDLKHSHNWEIWEQKDIPGVPKRILREGSALVGLIDHTLEKAFWIAQYEFPDFNQTVCYVEHGERTLGEGTTKFDSVFVKTCGYPKDVIHVRKLIRSWFTVGVSVENMRKI